MIKLEVINDEKQHFLVSGNEPFRVEVSPIGSSRIIAHVYRGVQVDPEQEPALCYDGSITGDERGGNRSWVSYMDGSSEPLEAKKA